MDKMRFRGRLLFNVLTLVLIVTEPAIRAQQQPANPTRCGEYYDDRIAYLLGCCGDQPIVDYPGPTFPDQMGPAERATHALAEIENAKRFRCHGAGSEGANKLSLNAISARLMRAQARSHSRSTVDLNAAVRDSEQAMLDLQSFVNSQPASAQRIWYWIGMAFRRGGQTWKALRFVAGLPDRCCQSGEKDVFLADLYFDLGIFDAASEHYSAWLKALGSTCGHEASIRNVGELRRRGFHVPPVPTIAPGTCVSGGEWQPTYIAKIPGD